MKYQGNIQRGSLMIKKFDEISGVAAFRKNMSSSKSNFL